MTKRGGNKTEKGELLNKFCIINMNTLKMVFPHNNKLIVFVLFLAFMLCLECV